MKTTQRNFAVLAGLAILLTLVPSQVSSEEIFPVPSQSSLKIAVSIVPEMEWVTSIGGDHVEVGALIPAGQSPHSYEPTTNELIFMADADVWFQIGLTDYEIAHETALMEAAESPTFQAVNLSVGLDILASASHDHEESDAEVEGNDPHIWLSPTRVISMVETIRDKLVELDSANSAEYSANALAYINQLTMLNTSINEKLEVVENRHVLIFHPSWGYFCNDYGLELIPLEEEGKDPTSVDFIEVIDEAREYNVGTIFIQEEVSDKVAQAFAEEACVEIVQLSPLAANYIENLNATADILAEKLDQAPDCSSRGIAGYPAGIILFSAISMGIILQLKAIHKLKK